MTVEEFRQRKASHWIDWDDRRVLDETVEYLSGGQVVFVRPRCPAINAKKNPGTRCSSAVGPGHETCWNHRQR